MLIKDAFQFGYITKTKGLKGEMMVHVLVDFAGEIDFDTVFIDLNGKLVPYFVDHFSMPKTNTAYLQLQDVSHIDDAQKLVKKSVYLGNELLPEESDEFTFEDLVGFTAQDKNLGELGEIISVEEYPQQWIATVHHNDRDIMFPLNDDFIEEIDDENDVLHLVLPDGLLDVYTSPEKL